MLDIKWIRKNIDLAKSEIKIHAKEGTDPMIIDRFLEVDALWREKSTKLQELNNERNKASASISELLKQGKKEEVEEIKATVTKYKDQIEALNTECNDLEKKLKLILFSIPNILDKSVPLGDDENSNVVIKKIDPTTKNFKVLNHRELALKNKLIDFDRGAKLSGSRGYIMTGEGAKLMRALRNFTLDLHTNDGYTEVIPPTLINEPSLYGLGKIPFFQEDMYKTDENLYLTATEEFPITAMFSNEILDIKSLPLRYTGSNCSWRKEAGSAGRDVGGILRVHYFHNTELVNFTTKEQSWTCLDEMTKQAEKVLDLLEIPYRTVLLCSGDTGAASAKTFDIEVWVPSENKYREISSCSNCLDYQARGLGIKYRDDKTKVTEFVHTLNGTGTSLNRLWIAVVENFQQEDGSIIIPKKLVPYMNGLEVIK